MKYIVEYRGEIEVEAECLAASECRPDNCRVISGSEEDEDEI